MPTTLGSGTSTITPAAPKARVSNAQAPSLTVTPDNAVLQNPNTKFPYVIDPDTYVGYDTFDTFVESAAATTANYSSPQLYAGPFYGGSSRILMNFDDSSIVGTDVTAATLTMQNYLAETSPYDTWQVWRTGTASTSTTWNAQPAWTSDDESSTSYNTTANSDISTSILTTAQAWAAGSSSTVGIGIRTNPEATAHNVLAINSLESSYYPPYIQLTYDKYPNTPTALTSTGLNVYSGTNYVNTTTPTLSAVVTDPDGGSLAGAYTVTDTTTSTVVVAGAAGKTVTSGGTSTYKPPTLNDGDTYQVQVWGNDGTALSLSPASTLTFTVDATAPNAPGVSSTAFPAGVWTSTSSGVFSFSDTSSDVVAWNYQFNSSAPVTLTGGSSYGPTLTPPAGSDTLTVWAIDRAGNISPETTYSFAAGPAGMIAPVDQESVPSSGYLPLDAGAPMTATNVRFRYQVGSISSAGWQDIPTSHVTDNGGSTTWPENTTNVSGVARPPQSGGTTALAWNVAATIPAATTATTIYVEAYFTNGGSSHWETPYVTIQFDRTTFNNAASSTTAGPCTVSLWTGTCSLGATDFSAQTPGDGSLGFGRTFSSDTTVSSGPFGPGWTSSLPISGVDPYELTDTGAPTGTSGGGAYITDAGSSTSTYSFSTTDGTTYTPSSGEDVTDGWTLTKTGSGTSATFTLVRPTSGASAGSATVSIVYSLASHSGSAPSGSSPWVYTVRSITSPTTSGTAPSETISYNSNGYPLEILAPQPAGADCDSTWVAGCEELNFTYGGPSGQLSSVSLKTADSYGTASTTDVACYAYTSGYLTSEWDPRTTSSTCGSPVLATTYGYSGNLVDAITPPGQATWNITYASGTGQVTDVARQHSSTYGSATQQYTFVYNASMGSTSGSNPKWPDLSATARATWGQTQAPVTATAVFGPGTAPVSGDPTDLRFATVYGLDLNGQTLDTATFNGNSYSQSGWNVDTTEYDANGNVTSELTPDNRHLVLIDNCTLAGLPTGCDAATLATALSTINEYTTASDGIDDLTDTFGPSYYHVVLPTGLPATAREHTHYTYGTYAPGSVPGDCTTGGPMHDVVQQVEGASLSAFPIATSETDDRTTDYAYGLSSSECNGFTLGTPESTTTVMSSGSNIVRQTLYGGPDGQESQVRQPSAANNSSSPADTNFTYYTADTTANTPDVDACVNSAWLDMLCTTGPATAPTTTGLPGLPTTQVRNYDYLLRPTCQRTRVTDADGTTQYTKYTTTTYDNGGLATRELSTATTGGEGAATDKQTYGYNDSSPGNGLLTSITATTEPGGSADGSVSGSYDDFGNLISFTDANGATTTTTPTITDEPGTVVLTGSGGNTIQTATYTYASGYEHRDLPTEVQYTGGTGHKSVGTFQASYDPDGSISSELMPDSSTVDEVPDTQGNVISKTYSNDDTSLFSDNEELYNIHGQVAVSTRYDDTTDPTLYTYDSDGRLVTTQATLPDGDCTTRIYNLDVDSNRTNASGVSALSSYPSNSDGTCTTSTTPSAQSLTYDNTDRLLSSGSASGLTYDAFGRITTLPADLVGGTGTGSEQIGFYNNDMVNTLQQGSGPTETWTLDPAGRDYQATTSGTSTSTLNHYSDFFGDSPSWSVLTNPSGVSSTSVNDRDLDGDLVAVTADAGSSHDFTYELTNQQGNVVDTVNANNPDEFTTSINTDEFGNVTNSTGAVANGPRYGWLGGDQRDASSVGGVVLMGARGYVPSLGRFLTVDPILGGNDNPYSYPADPVNGSDISGKASWHIYPVYVNPFQVLHFVFEWPFGNPDMPTYSSVAIEIVDASGYFYTGDFHVHLIDRSFNKIHLLRGQDWFKEMSVILEYHHYYYIGADSTYEDTGGCDFDGDCTDVGPPGEPPFYAYIWLFF